MDFSYSPDQLDVKSLAAKILKDNTSNERQKEVDAQFEKFDAKLWHDLADAGLLAVALDEQYGGSGFGFETLCLLFEELGRTVAALPLVPTLVSAFVVQKYGSAQLCREYLPSIARGEKMLTVALYELANDDATKPNTVAEYSSKVWTLSGVKAGVPFAASAAGILVPAQTPTGLAVFLLNPQVEEVSLENQISTTGEPQCLVTMNNAGAELVADGEVALAMVGALVQQLRAGLCSMAVGLTDSMMRMTASYTSERQQFGVPIATFQAVGHRAADCYIDIECLRLTTQQAVSLIAQGKDAVEAVTIAKMWAGDVCHRVSQASQHLHGGIGVDRDYPLFRYCLWAKQIELTCGASASLTQALGEKIAADFLAAEAVC